MALIPVNKIQDGMILKQPVLGPSGQIILAEGQELKESLISRLKSRGIKFVDVEGENVEEIKKVSGQELEEDLLYKFSLHNEDPLMQKIYNHILEFKLKNEQH